MRTSTRILFLSLFLAFGAGVLGACSPVVKTFGHKPDEERVAELRPGQHDRDDVAEILGPPSSIASFKPETWFYISKRTERTAFLATELKEAEVVALTFNDRGILHEVKTVDKDARKDISPVERKTPTSGYEMGVIEQLIGNFGRFNEGGTSAAGAPTR